MNKKITEIIHFTEIIEEPIYDEPQLPPEAPPVKDVIYDELLSPPTINEEYNSEEEEAIYDCPNAEPPAQKSSSVVPSKYYEDCKVPEVMLLPPKPPKRTTSLRPIDERSEYSSDSQQEVCYHGYRNGCTAHIQSPSEVSREIFQENWLKRLESLRQRETLLRDKETALQERERGLFKKERDLRILERRVKQRERELDDDKSLELLLESGMNMDKGSQSCKNLSEVTKERLKGLEVGSYSAMRKLEAQMDKVQSTSSLEDKSAKNPPNSKISSLLTKSSEVVSKSSLEYRRGRYGYNSVRVRSRPKVHYDDLNSTLSADVGDSSLIVTSRMFDPNAFKRPLAFTKNKPDPSENHYSVIDEDRVLQKISENLAAQSSNVQFQDYGLIDNEPADNTGKPKKETDPKRHSFFSLESKGAKPKSTKERPVSWNEETNEWLQKKRLAYNLATKKIPAEDLDNKENADRDSKDKGKKKKEGRGMFNLFR